MTGAVFLFGKLPAHGDFVSRGLDEGTREAWDAWASSALEALRQAAPDFEAAHDAAPPWRFIAGPSVLGAGWRCGALAPSIDSAGRRFIAAAGIEVDAAAVAAVCGLTIASIAETVLYQAIGEQMTADAALEMLNAQLSQSDHDAVAQALAAHVDEPGVWWAQGSGLNARTAAAPPPDLLAAACPLDLRSTAA